MVDRFFIPELLAQSVVELAGSEAHHLLHVLRMSVGDAVELFDGQGHLAAAQIASLGKKSVELQVISHETEAMDERFLLTLATAVPKGERFRWLIEKATELGVSRLVPLDTTRSVVHPSDGKLEKMQQTVIAACKQSGRNRLMQIDGRMSWNDFLSHQTSDSRVFIAHPGGERFEDVLTETKTEKPVVAAVGPEGGLTDEEVDAAVAAGARLVNLGPRILRIETAGIALAAILTQRLRGR